MEPESADEFSWYEVKSRKTADAILTRIYASGLTFYNGWKRVDDRI